MVSYCKLSRRSRPTPPPWSAIGAPNDNCRPPPAPFVGIEPGPSRSHAPHPLFQRQGPLASVDSGLKKARNFSSLHPFHIPFTIRQTDGKPVLSTGPQVTFLCPPCAQGRRTRCQARSNIVRHYAAGAPCRPQICPSGSASGCSKRCGTPGRVEASTTFGGTSLCPSKRHTLP